MGITKFLKKKVEEKQEERKRKMELRQQAREERYKGYKEEFKKIEREKGRKMARGDTQSGLSKAANFMGAMTQSVGEFGKGFGEVFGPPKKKKATGKTITVRVVGATQVKKKKKKPVRAKHPYEYDY